MPRLRPGSATPTSPPPVGGDQKAAFRYVLNQVARSVEALYRTADQLCCSNPAVAAHVRELADSVAGQTLDCLKRWPS
jgi:hypothetical protein